MTRGRLYLSKNGLIWELNETVSVPPKRKHLVSAQPPEGSGATHKGRVPSVADWDATSSYFWVLPKTGQTMTGLIFALNKWIATWSFSTCFHFPCCSVACSRGSVHSPQHHGEPQAVTVIPVTRRELLWLLWHWHWQGVFVPLSTNNWSCASYKWVFHLFYSSSELCISISTTVVGIARAATHLW